MALELLAAIVAAIACAGLALMARKISGGRLPVWITPFAAGFGLIAFTVWSEYDWFPRLRATLPEGVEVVWSDATPQPLRPWSFVLPLQTRFMAMDTRRLAPHPDHPALVLAPVYAFARWRGVEEGFLILDCPGRRSVPLTKDIRLAPDGMLSGAEWQAMAPEDAIYRTGCSGADSSPANQSP